MNLEILTRILSDQVLRINNYFKTVNVVFIELISKKYEDIMKEHNIIDRNFILPKNLYSHEKYRKWKTKLNAQTFNY